MTSHSDQKCVRDYQDVDHLSNLPDEILCHIFSFVPSKSAYKMRIFSKQWEQLLAKVPVLDFSEMPHSIMYNKRLTSQQIIYLKDFVQKVLLHNDVPYIQRLHLCCGPFGWDDDHCCVNSWLDTIRKRDIHEIEITYSYWSKVYFVLPTKFLSRDGLVVLKLNGKFTFDDPMLLHLPNLEILHFGGLQFPNDEFIKRLSSGCPVLKELRISQCTGITKTLYVESLSLKKLDIWYITKKTEQAGIVIKAPNLRYLYLNDTLKQPVIGDLSSLVEANLSIEYDTVDYALQVLQSVSMVKFLSLINSDHYRFVSKSPVFHNLTCLELDNTDKLCTLLGCTPKLKCLIFTQQVYAKKSLKSKPVPMCLSSLKKVHLCWFQGIEEEMELVAYFLKFAPLLKEMKIHMMSEIIKCVYPRLLMLPRSSPACQLKVIPVLLGLATEEKRKLHHLLCGTC